MARSIYHYIDKEVIITFGTKLRVYLSGVAEHYMGNHEQTWYDDIIRFLACLSLQ